MTTMQALTDAFAETRTWPDDRLVRWAATQISVPKRDPADSFVLHAPLELLARAALLPWVRPEQRGRARARVVALVAGYRAAGPPVDPPSAATPAGVPDAAERLVKALDAGDLDDVDRYAVWLAAHASVGELRRRLAPAVVPALGAAGHASIGLHLIGRAPAYGGALLRGALRDIARHPDWRVPIAGLAAGGEPLVDALLDTPELGLPGSDFIYPMVHQGEGLAAARLAHVAPDRAAAARAVSRVAAWSMLQDTPTYAPYGWTHTLTIPQAVLALHELDPSVAVAVAGTQVLGFRAALGRQTLRTDQPVPTVGPDVVADLATAASLHHDAHLVKYTLACFDAAVADPDQRDLYLAAASALTAWWAEQPDDNFYDDALVAEPG